MSLILPVCLEWFSFEGCPKDLQTPKVGRQKPNLLLLLPNALAQPPLPSSFPLPLCLPLLLLMQGVEGWGGGKQEDRDGPTNLLPEAIVSVGFMNEPAPDARLTNLSLGEFSSTCPELCPKCGHTGSYKGEAPSCLRFKSKTSAFQNPGKEAR